MDIKEITDYIFIGSAPSKADAIFAVGGSMPWAAAMKVGGQGDRYTIRVNGKDTYLFFERNASRFGNIIGRWFVERKVV